MSNKWRFFYPGYLFTIPMTLIGFVLAVVFYRAIDWVWYKGVLTCVADVNQDGSTRIWGKPNAQTLGWIQIYDTNENRLMPDLRVHETVHVVQAFAGSLLGIVFTPLLFILIGWSPLIGFLLGGFAGGLGFSILYAILFGYLLIKRNSGWYDAYRNNPFEVQAYDLQDKYIENQNTKPWGV